MKASEVTHDTKRLYDHYGLVPEFPAAPVTVPNKNVQNRDKVMTAYESKSASGGRVWVRHDYQATNFVTIDGSQSTLGAPRWADVYRRGGDLHGGRQDPA